MARHEHTSRENLLHPTGHYHVSPEYGALDPVRGPKARVKCGRQRQLGGDVELEATE